MSVLNEEEIENLKKIHPQKRILRFIFLIVGCVLIFSGILLLLLGFDFGIIIDDINYSFVVDILISVLGMILASKFFIATYYLRENSLFFKKLIKPRESIKKIVKFNSIAITRLIAAGLLIAVGLITLIIFGTDIGHEVQFGSAVFLGGPSFFYVSGLPALGIGIGLLLYFFLSIFKGTFSQSENFYFFYEARPLFNWLTEIPKKDIEAVRFQNNHLGPKLAWIIVLIPFIVLQLMTGIQLFTVEKAAPLHVLSWTFTVISIVEIFVLIVLIIFPQNYYEIATEKMLYEMWLSPYKSKKTSKITEEIRDFLNCGIESEFLNKNEKEELKNANRSIFSDVSNTHFQLFNSIFGVFLIISGIIISTQMVLFGPLFWWVALIYGIILLIKAFSYDFSQQNADKFYYDQENKIFKFQRKFRYKFHYITAYNIESLKVRKWFRKLDFFDIFGLTGMLFFLTVQQVEGWGIVNTFGLLASNIFSTIYLLIVFFFIILYLCHPIHVIEFKTNSITYRIQVTLKLIEKNLFQKYLNNLKNFPKEVLKDDMKKTFFIRIAFIAILFLVPLIFTISMLISFFY
ncbi:MAG: hypothetical protein ACTSRI_06830 [Promethearchaeota archaeon]